MGQHEQSQPWGGAAACHVGQCAFVAVLCCLLGKGPDGAGMHRLQLQASSRDSTRPGDAAAAAGPFMLRQGRSACPRLQALLLGEARDSIAAMPIPRRMLSHQPAALCSTWLARQAPCSPTLLEASSTTSHRSGSRTTQEADRGEGGCRVLSI